MKEQVRDPDLKEDQKKILVELIKVEVGFIKW